MPTAPNQQFYVVGGTVNPDSPSYVVRQADQELFDRVMAGDFCYVLTSRQMGKSSLMARAAKRLSEAGLHTAIVDLTSIGTEKEKQSADQWYYGIAHRILRELAIRDVALNRWWQSRSPLPALQRLTEFFSDLLLERVAGRIVIFIDEIDSTISLPFTDDFFAAIRACYNARATEPDHNRLSFVLLGVASPSDLVKDNTRTPFNIGQRVELTDFTFEEAKPLAKGLSVNGRDDEQILRRVLDWTGGHPYLTQKLCGAIQYRDRQGADGAGKEVDSLAEQSFLSQTASREDSNLNFVRDWMKGNKKLGVKVFKLYRRVRRGETVADAPLSPVQNHLKLSGVVTLRPERALRVRNRVYERVFTAEWAKKAMPVDWNRRLAVASAAMLLVSLGFWYAVLNPRQYIAPIQNAMDDYPSAACQSLRRFPWYAGKADELLAQFWERRALRDEGEGRDEALLERLQAVAAKPTELRRKEAALLIGGDYRSLIFTVRHGDSVTAVAYSPDGKRLLTGSDDGTARQWDAQSGEQIGEPLRHGSVVYAVAYSPDGKRLLTGSWGDTARQWDARSGEQIGEPLHHGAYVYTVAYSPDGKRLLIGSDDGTARQWDAQSGEQIGEPLRHGNFVYAVAYSPDGKRLLTGSIDGAARQWDARSGEQIGEPLRHVASVYDVTYSPDGKRLLTGNSDGTARQWDARSGEQIGEALRHGDSVSAVAYSPDGKRLLTGSWYGAARQWDAQSGEQIGEPLRHGATVLAMAYSPDGKRLLTGSLDGTARQWDARSGKQIGEPPRHGAYVYAVAYSPDGKRLLTGSRDGTARQWDAQSGEQIGEPLRHGDSVYAVAYSPDGKRLLTGSDDGTARQWDAQSGQQIGESLRHGDYVYAVAYSPDGKRLLTGSNDGTARQWDTQSGQQIGEPLRHGDYVYAVAYSPDGKRLLTGSWDGTARQWDAQSGEQIGEPLRHGAPVTAVAFSPDGKYVLSQTLHWFYFSDVTGNGLTPKSSRFFSRLWATGYRFLDAGGARVQVVVPGAAGSLKIETVRFDAPDAEALQGDPAELLRDWQRRLGLKFDASQNQKLVPIYPVETRKAPNIPRPPGN